MTPRKHIDPISWFLEAVGSTEWMDQAECARPQYDPEDWWPSTGKVGVSWKLAVAICEVRCPVREQCLQWAVDNKVPHGIWGGMTPEERSRWARRDEIQENRRQQILEMANSGQ